MRVITVNSNPVDAIKKKASKHFNRKRILLFLGCIALLGFLFAGRWLVVNQEPQKSDVIFVLSGGEGRLHAALTLMEEGYSDKIVLTNARGFSHLEHISVNEQVPSYNIYEDYDSRSTLASAQYSLKLMEEKDLDSALVVTSDYHMRRTKLNYDRAFDGSGIELTYIATDTRYRSLFWWTDKYSIGVTSSEYIKLVGNFVGIHGALAKRQLYEFDNYFFS